MSIRRLGRAIRTSLKGDRKRRVEAAGTDVEALLGGDPPNAKDAWRRMKGWYKDEVSRALPPAQATLQRITAEQVELYSYVPPPGENIPVTVTPSELDDSVPMEDEIAEAVKKLRRNRSGGAVRDAHRAAERVDRGVQQRKTGGKERRGENGGRGGRRGLVGKTGGAHADGVLGGRDGGGGHVADRGTHLKRKEGLQRDWVGRGHVEGSGGDITSPAHDSNNLPRRATRLPGGLRYWDFLPHGRKLL